MDAAQVVLDSLSDAVIAASGEGLVTGWLGGAEQLLGYTAAEAVGLPVSLFFARAPERDLEELATLGGAPGIDTVAHIRHRSGRELPAEISVRALADGSGTVALVRPLGPRRPDPEWDRVLGRLLRELIELAGANLSAVDRTDALARVLVEQGRRIVPGTDCLMSLVPHDRQDHFRIIAGSGEWAEAQVGSEWPRAGTVAGLAMERRRPLETVRLLEHSALRPRLEAGDIHTGRLIPLLTHEPLPDGRSALGVFGFYRREVAYFTPYQRRLMNEFVRLATLTLQRTELIAATARAVGRLRVGVEAAYDLASTLAPGQVARALIDRALAASGADRVSVLRVDRELVTVLESVDTGGTALPVGRQYQLSDWRDLSPQRRQLIRLALATGEIWRAPGHSIESLPEHLARPVSEIRHTLVLPLGTASPPVALVFGRRQDRPFGEEDVATVRTLGNMAALALRNAWLYGQVEEAARVKTDFLNLAAHELRTPLTVVRGYLSMLREGSFSPVPASWEDPLKILAAKTDELGHLVDNLLLAARLDTGQLPLLVAPVDLNQVVAAAVERARAHARQLDADLRFEGARRPLVVQADATHLARILDALLANALTYAGDQRWVRARVRPDTGGRARVEIEDHGLGVAPDHAPRIFERFYRAAEAVAEAGTGLGLYIGRELAARMGGTLELERSEPGLGSLFVLSMPEAEPGPGD
ncbi:MAG TPA: ATP-binding protein [Candidatus Dormibacteraeota bacterium]